MKLKQRPDLFPSKPRATQRRNSLQRIKDEILHRNVRILLSPLPDHLSPFKISRKSITNFSTRKSVTLINRRDEAEHANEKTEKSPYPAPIVKSPRKRSRRKNEAEKLQEELPSKKYINDENIFRSRRALRTRLVLTPKLPLVRVKKVTRQSVKSRKLSSTSLNKFLNHDFVIELEKLPTREESLEKKTSKKLNVEESQPETEQNVDIPGVQIPSPWEFKIELEKLPVEPENLDEIEQRSAENLSHFRSPAKHDAGSSEVFDASKDAPLRDIRILLEKLPDTPFSSVSEPSLINETDEERIDKVTKVTLSDDSEKRSSETGSLSEDDGSIDEPCKKPTTPLRNTIAEQAASPVTPAAVSKSLSTPISTPIYKTVENAETSGRKTPKSLDVPLRRVTIVKSKFSKMSRALESPIEPFRTKIQPTSTTLSSPSTKSHTSQIDKTKNKISWSNNSSSLESSKSVIVSLPSSPSASIILDEESTVAEISQTASPSSYIWKGTIVMPEAAKCSVVLKKVSGNCEGLGDNIRSIESSIVCSLNCIGRIHPNVVWDYLRKVKKVNRKDILVLRFEAVETDDEPNYQRLHSYLRTRNRLAVVGKTGSAIKDFYVMPLSRNSSLPEVLLPLDEPGFKDSRSDLLLAVIVRSRQMHYEDLQRAHPQHIRQSNLLHRSRQSHPIGSILEAHKRTELQSEESPSTSQSTPLCTEVVSPLSRGQLLTQKSLASSPNPRKVLLIKSAQNVRSPKNRLNRDSGEKTLAKSPMNRGRLLMEQSLAASPNASKRMSHSASVGSAVYDSLSNSSSGRRKPNDVSYKQKWSSAGDLLKISSKEKDQQMEEEDTSPIASPLDMSLANQVFSNEKTCTAILSTLQISDRSKSKSTSNVKKMLKGSMKPASRSQPDLSQKLAEVKNNATKPSVFEQANLKNNFLIPKIKPGLSTSTKIPTAPLSSLPRSGFTPSPPAKSTLTQSVLNLGTHILSSHSASSYSRKLPTKPSQSTNSKPSLAKHTSTSNIRPSSAKLFYSSGSQSSTIKPTLSSSSQSSSLAKRSSPLSLKGVPSYTSSTQHLLSSEQSQSAGSHIFAKPFPVSSKDPRLAKSLPTPSQTTSNRLFQTSQPMLASPKPQNAAKPKPSNMVTPSSRSFQKSKSGGLKVAYMGWRSSNNTSFSKYLPSGPQYSPSYSKYLQNGFSRLPDVNVSPKPKTPRPTSPGTSSILRWSTVKPWVDTKRATPSKASSASLTSKSTQVSAGSTTSMPTAESVKPPTGPSDSLTSSTLTSNPEYSPLCPQFDF